MSSLIEVNSPKSTELGYHYMPQKRDITIMPELPEVETTRAGLTPHCLDRQIYQIDCRIDKLRQNIDQQSLLKIEKYWITEIRRRGKYLIFNTDNKKQSLLIHLGMSGSLRVVPSGSANKKHDHITIHLNDAHEIRFHDPRRFGHFEVVNMNKPHRLLDHLGIEPLDDDFNADYLYKSTRNRRSAIKNHIMNQNIVVGVGNIYASEALFLSAIHPNRLASSINKDETRNLVDAIKAELTRAIALGGTTLRDFVQPDGNNGYFQQTLKVYGNTGNLCPQCTAIIKSLNIGGRASAYCPNCQR